MNVIRPKNWEGYNAALGVHTTSKRDFMEKMKRAGCDFTHKVKVKDTTPPLYKQSKWAKDMISTAMQSKRGKKSWKPGDRFMDELKKRGITKEMYEKGSRMSQEHMDKTKKGGFC